MTEPEWVRVSIESKRVVSSADGRVLIEWALAGGWNTEWAQTFAGAGNRSGSMDFVMGTPDPLATNAKVIVWQVPEGDLAGAVSYVAGSVAVTNDAYRALQVRKKQDALQRHAKATAEDAHLQELQRKLDELG